MIDMNSKKRVFTTLDHIEPDRVPFYELSIESPDVVNGYGEKNIISLYDLDVEYMVKLYTKIGVDLCMVPITGLPLGKSAGFGKKKKGVKTPKYSNMADEFGRLITYHKLDKNLPDNMANYIGGMFDSETGDVDEMISKYEKWAPVDAKIELRYVPFSRGLNTAGEDGPFVIPGSQGFFENSWQPFGYENFIKLLFERSDFIKEVLQRMKEFFEELIEILKERFSINLLMYLDDFGHKTGPLISPRKFKELYFPRIKDLVRFCHKQDIKIIHHSCGNVNKILDLLVETGIDGLNPLEPSADMSIFKVHKKYGDKITLIGNVDTIDLLAKGSPEEIKDYVIREIKECAPGGGFIMASSHSTNPQITFENYKTMVETTKKYGIYPIQI